MTTTKKKLILSLSLLGLLAFGILSWLSWINGRVVAQGLSPSGHDKVVVRSVPYTTNPVYMFIPLHSRFYRCEYYWVRNNRLRSSQAFAEDSYIAEKIEIKWLNDREATVSFDDFFTLKMKDEFWFKEKTQSD